MYKQLLFVVSLFVGSALIAQTRKVTGKVFSEELKPLNGATVQLRNSKTSTSTDANGEFSISVPENQKTTILKITSVGFEAQEVTAKAK